MPVVKRGRGLVAIVGLLGLASLGLWLAWPRSPVDSKVESSLVRAPEHPEVRRITIEDPGQHWPREGFIEMVPPVRLPSSSAELDDVEIWLWLPPSGEITTKFDPGEQRWILGFPAGTIADRVEWRGKGERRAIADVRGARIDDAGREWMHTLRRTSNDPAAPLFGYEWPRDDPSAHAEATELLLAELGQIEPGSQMSADKREHYLGSIRRKNECVACHVVERPVNQREGEHGVVNRGTDASGWFTPATVLMDELPLESYGDVDRNLDARNVELRCPEDQPLGRETRGRRVRATCAKGAVPLARFDLRAALLEGDERAQRVCSSRIALYERLDSKGQAGLVAAIEPCRR